MSLAPTATAPEDDGTMGLPAQPPLLVQLLLRPDALFTGERVYLTKRATFIIILTLGASTVFDRLDRLRALTERGAGAMLAGFVVGTLVGGLLHWALFSGLFRLRIRMCGARHVDQDRAQAIFGCTSVVPAVVALVASLMDLLPGRDPTDGWFMVVVLAAFLWSAYAGYRGVVAAFPVSRGKARFWFLLIPAIVFVLLAIREAGLG